jgi:outer membrane protein OmpA-like peptidoglycan-associated protein
MRLRNVETTAFLITLLLVTASCAASQDEAIAPSVPTTSATVATTAGEDVGLAKAVPVAEPPELTARPEVAASSAKEAPRDTAKPETSAPETVAAERRAIEALDRISPFVPSTRDKRGVVVTLSTDDLFEPGDSKLSSTAMAKLDDLAGALRLQGDRTIEIDGFTDSLGDPSENVTLSSRRAEALRAYFATKGVDPAKMNAEGFGSKRPLADNRTSFGRAQNRRLEVVIGAASSVARKRPGLRE